MIDEERPYTMLLGAIIAYGLGKDFDKFHNPEWVYTPCGLNWVTLAGVSPTADYRASGGKGDFQEIPCPQNAPCQKGYYHGIRRTV